MRTIDKLFFEHPHAVNEGYFEHMAFAFTFSARLFKAAFAAAVHGVVPAACETTASSTIMAMHDEISARRALMAKATQPGPAMAEASLPHMQA